MAPELWRELIKPELARMVEGCHEADVIYQHHSCGYIEPILPDLVEIGVSAEAVKKNTVASSILSPRAAAT